MFLCEYCKFLKNIYFEEYLQTAALNYFSFNPLLKSVCFSKINMHLSKMCFFICSIIVKETYKNVEKKCFTLNEATDYLDNLQVSTDGSDSEDDSNFQSAKIFI